MKSLRKDKNPFEKDQVVTCIKTFGNEVGVAHAGEKYRGGDAIVESAWSAFVAGEPLAHELPSFWDQVPAPPEHRSSEFVDPRSLREIQPHRRVTSQVVVAVPASYAPGSEGERLQREGRMNPPRFGRTHLAIGQVLDVLDPVVRDHPDWFRFEQRDVTAADVARAERLDELEREEVSGGEAAA